MNYSRLPNGNSQVNKKSRESATDALITRLNNKLVAQYKTEIFGRNKKDVSLTVYEWNSNEYEEPYVVMIHTGDIDEQKVNQPKYVTGMYSLENIINCINIFLDCSNSGWDNFSIQFKKATVEPWGSMEEYEEYRKEKHMSARAEWETRKKHESARAEWEKEKRSREIVRELEKEKHEFNIPKIPEVPDEEINDIRRKYSNGDITLLEMENKIEDILGN